MDRNIDKQQSIDFLLKNIAMFSEEDRPRLEAAIEGHKYFLDTQLSQDVSWTDATYSWMENVYLPISEAMETFTTSSSFPGMKRDDVFFALCDHWYFMSQKQNKEYDPFSAAIDYDANYGHSIGRWLARMQRKTVA